ncbi:hypothetical protein LPJ72_004528 [Coemansia sp. Benny D160-2]|nr:hypothetical protein LPJ72_004528 [Coemansia sp. Benny D160-2]
MAAKRPIVSYDDLFEDENEGENTTTQAPAIEHHAEAMAAETSDNDSDDIGADAWDDTELIRAWDGAIADYRKHHAELVGDPTYMAQRSTSESVVGRWMPAESSAAPGAKRQPKRKRSAEEPDIVAAVDAGGPAPPESEEDALHKLTMAWYYAGYYAGYYQAAYRTGKQPTESHDAALAAAADANAAGEKLDDTSGCQDQE